MPFVDLVGQYESIADDIDAAIRRVVGSASFIGGNEVTGFEREFAEFQEAPHCIGVGNGTDALEILLEALDLPAGSEVIVPANSFVASSEAVTRAGLEVVFADVDPEDYSLDVDDVASRIGPNTRALMPVHLFGQPARMRELGALAEQHGLQIVEDAAQAHGARFDGRRVGCLGVGGTFSFYPGKNLGAYGDAGAVVVRDADLAQRVRMIANHGRISKYDHEFEGRSSRLDGLQAAILRAKLPHLDRWSEQRRALAGRYREGLAGVGDLALPVEVPDTEPVYHLFVVQTSERDRLRDHLRSEGIGCGVHYPIALPALGAYRDHPQHEEPFRAVELSQRILSLPMADALSIQDVDRVVDSVRSFFGA